MSKPTTNSYEPDFVAPPGDTLLELLEERHMTQSELAQRMGRPLKTINEIIRGKTQLTPETALQLELVFGTTARVWLNLEQSYQEHLGWQAAGESL
ncbi:MAG: HigA family addiction module antidote protein [Chloroflexi bacterium]|nr:HigA family addiction module antidote protein [Chloroflexota bacterium]